MKGKRLLIIALIFIGLLHLSTLSGFFTNDDFFHFRISEAANITAFINFFNPLHQPQGYGWYRPLANQVYYFLGHQVFSLNPVPMRLMMLINYLSNIFLVWYFIRYLSRSDLVSGVAVFLYSVSAALFTSAWLVGVQERPLTFFFLFSAVFFVKFLEKSGTVNYLLVFIAFIFALWCKESAVVIPLVFLGLVWYIYPERIRISLKKAVLATLPLFFMAALFMFFKLFFFGLAAGDSYVWQFSPRIMNTFGWYSLWSLNIPEMFIDYIGPGLHISPRLLKYWGRETFFVSGLFLAVSGSFLISLWKNRFKFSSGEKKLILLGLFWFCLTISPVLGMPLHKFPHYLSVPLAGSALTISVIITRSLNRKQLKWFLIAYSLLYLMNFSISTQTNWAYTGQKIARKVHELIRITLPQWPKSVNLVFYDTAADSVLPWSPAATLKLVLSDNNYFRLFYPNRITAVYLSRMPAKLTVDMQLIAARQFLGY